ncbi:MAG: hypothetical protein CVU08_06790 [Bacteroidetes bacterium HGW-Bacteroidetes-3]|nr:MAG: hypothetical protein CVU08_06790 [Bacteroidetes bacterium HGW-Bacteroidetes-3]
MECLWKFFCLAKCFGVGISSVYIYFFMNDLAENSKKLIMFGEMFCWGISPLTFFEPKDSQS